MAQVISKQQTVIMQQFNMKLSQNEQQSQVTDTDELLRVRKLR